MTRVSYISGSSGQPQCELHIVIKYDFNSKETSSEQRNLSHSGGSDGTEEFEFYVTEDTDSEEDVHIGIGGVVEETLATIK